MEIIPFDHLSRSFHAPVLQSMTELYEHGTHDPVRVQGAAVAALRTLIAAAARAGGSFGAASGLLALDDEALAARWGAVPAMGRPAVEARRAEPSLYGEAAFKTYLERTSGTTGSPFRVVRSSHSLQREFLRMRYVLRYFATRLAVALPSRIVYLSDYPAAQSYQYLDTTDWPVFVYKITCRTPVELARHDQDTVQVDVRRGGYTVDIRAVAVGRGERPSGRLPVWGGFSYELGRASSGRAERENSRNRQATCSRNLRHARIWSDRLRMPALWRFSRIPQ